METPGPMTSGAAALRHALVHVILTMEAGIEADRQGRTADAVALLRSACNMADAIVPALPSAHATVVNRRSVAARSRLAAAQATLAAAEDDEADAIDGATLQLGPIETFSAKPASRYVEPPASALRRPFWLLQQLSASIQGTGWLTPTLRVDKTIWLQDGGASVLSFLADKTRFLEALCRALEPVAAMTVSQPGFVEELDRCVVAAAKAARAFEEVASQEDGRVEQLGRLERGMRSLLSKSRGVLKTWNMQQESSQGTYVAWAFRLCNAGAGVERLLLDAHAAQDATSRRETSWDDAIDRIHRLSSVLLRGPCRFLLEDALLLADRAVSERKSTISRPNVHW
eukprot:CAMPEP_0174854380 /NCGR_PEP_ID=MMETSP1114-20130205/30990_1 /TAXON_ID=312471 /ORGANISM="Neobodo designis, Strain CCAP 1951/1" /LENGTH=341 /DNA_ID=CAMNT_0016089071 /DNA_START=31 /DNA_END=1053 /DNA_ORIENTATION=+